MTASRTLAWNAKLLAYQLPEGRQEKGVMCTLGGERGTEKAAENLDYLEENDNLQSAGSAATRAQHRAIHGCRDGLSWWESSCLWKRSETLKRQT